MSTKMKDTMISRLRALSVLALLIALAFSTSPAVAQEDDNTPKKYENVDWNNVVLVNFKPGKADRAIEIISQHFMKASEAAGTSMPVLVEMQSGEWDMMLIWTMKEGPASMEWERSPDNVKWRQAMMEQMEGEEEMADLWDEYTSLIANSTSYIGISGRHGQKLAAAQ